MELDYRTGQVLAALRESGQEDNTIIIWISDNGPTTTGTTYDEIGIASAGPFSGELGDAKEGSIRTVGMIKWPGKIKPRVSNEMFAIHDFFPTLANIIGAKVPTDRPIDGVDQTAILLGEQYHSNRESFLTFIGPRLAAVRWRQFRFYPITFSSTDGNPQIGGYVGRMGETAGFPEIYNIEADPREQMNIAVNFGWTVPFYAKIIGEYQKSLIEHPNPPAVNLTEF
jgi:arylsulfatase